MTGLYIDHKMNAIVCTYRVERKVGADRENIDGFISNGDT